MRSWLKITLKSGTTFSSGQGVAGDVDIDVEQEACGLPMIGGRTLKGLLLEECAAILDILKDLRWRRAAAHLFGTRAADHTPGILHIADAFLPDPVRQTARKAVERDLNRLHPLQVLDTVSEVRMQTRIDRKTGAPAATSLRSSRVVKSDLSFYASLTWLSDPDPDQRALLAGCTTMTRRGGLTRNRGRGRLQCRCLDEKQQDVTRTWLAGLQNEEART